MEYTEPVGQTLKSLKRDLIAETSRISTKDRIFLYLGGDPDMRRKLDALTFHFSTGSLSATMRRLINEAYRAMQKEKQE